MKNARLLANNLTAGYEKRTIISNVNVNIPENQISVILGANGCGKSTLLKTFARLIQPYDGQILLDRKLISSIPSKKVAQIMGFLPQSPIVPEGIKVTDLVTRGRFPYRKPLKGMTVEDFKAVEEYVAEYGSNPDPVKIIQMPEYVQARLQAYLEERMKTLCHF